MGAGEDHRKRAEFAFQGVEGQAKGFQGEGAQERAVAFFAENHVGPAGLIAVLENRDALLACDLRSVGQAKRLFGDRLYAQLLQDRGERRNRLPRSR